MTKNSNHKRLKAGALTRGAHDNAATGWPADSVGQRACSFAAGSTSGEQDAPRRGLHHAIFNQVVGLPPQKFVI
jgi:hypothetical protein